MDSDMVRRNILAAVRYLAERSTAEEMRGFIRRWLEDLPKEELDSVAEFVFLVYQSVCAEKYSKHTKPVKVDTDFSAQNPSADMVGEDLPHKSERVMKPYPKDKETWLVSFGDYPTGETEKALQRVTDCYISVNNLERYYPVMLGYRLGMIHGKRAERARRRGKASK